MTNPEYIIDKDGEVHAPNGYPITTEDLIKTIANLEAEKGELEAALDEEGAALAENARLNDTLNKSGKANRLLQSKLDESSHFHRCHLKGLADSQKTVKRLSEDRAKIKKEFAAANEENTRLRFKLDLQTSESKVKDHEIYGLKKALNASIARELRAVDENKVLQKKLDREISKIIGVDYNAKRFEADPCPSRLIAEELARKGDLRNQRDALNDELKRIAGVNLELQNELKIVRAELAGAEAGLDVALFDAMVKEVHKAVTKEFNARVQIHMSKVSEEDKAQRIIPSVTVIMNSHADWDR